MTDIEPKFLISGCFVNREQLNKLLETKEGCDEVIASIDMARCFFVVEQMGERLKKTGVELTKMQTVELYEIVHKVCFEFPDKVILAWMAEMSSLIEELLPDLKLQNYDC